MCKTLKDLVIGQSGTLDIKDCYVQTGNEDILGEMDHKLVVWVEDRVEMMR